MKIKRGKQSGVLALGLALALACGLGAMSAMRQYRSLKVSKTLATKVDDHEGFYGAESAMRATFHTLVNEMSAPTGLLKNSTIEEPAELSVVMDPPWMAPTQGEGQSLLKGPAGTPVRGEVTAALDPGNTRLRRFSVGRMTMRLPPHDPSDTTKVAPGIQRACGTYELPSGTYQRCINGAFGGPPLVDIKAASPTLEYFDGPIHVGFAQNVFIKWTSANVTNCEVTSTLNATTYSGPDNTGVNVGPMIAPETTFTLTCQSGGSPVTDAVVVRRGGNIFITSVLIAANSGSRNAFRNFCNARAASLGLGGSWKPLMCLSPWYSRSSQDSGTPYDARDYIQIQGPVVNMVGQVVANNAAQFWSANHLAPFHYHEGGGPVTYHHHQHFITGCTPQGRYNTNIHPWSNQQAGNFHAGNAAHSTQPGSANCNNFRSGNNTGVYVQHGLASRTDSQWAKHYIRSACNGSEPVACIRE